MLPCRYFCRYFRYLLKYFFLKCGDKLEQAEVTLKEIYEKVSLKVPLEQRRFFNFFNDTVAELEALYPDLLFKEGVHFTPVHDLSDENVVLPLYTPAIVDNILYLCGYDQQGILKQEFTRKSRNAYVHYWKNHAHNRRVRRMRW